MVGIVLRAEQGDERARDVGRMLERCDDGRQAEAHPGLAEVAEPGPEPLGFLRGEAGGDDQRIEEIVLVIAVEHFGDRRLDRLGALEQAFGGDPDRQAELEIVDRAEFAVLEPGRNLAEHAEPEILERGHCVRKREHALLLVDFQPQPVALVVGQAMEPRAAHGRAIGTLFVGQVAQPADIGRRLERAVIRPVAKRERRGVAGCNCRRAA